MDIKIVIEDTAIDILRKASLNLPTDIVKALNEAYIEETSELGKIQLGTILENIKRAEERNSPICQDTGIIIFYATIGNGFGNIAFLQEVLTKATQKATQSIPLRPNAVHPLTRCNSGDNTGTGMPIIHYEISDSDYIELIALPKGAGSENMSVLTIFPPSAGEKGIKKFVVDSVIAAGGKPCPPTIIGVGIGGCSDLAMTLAKKALLRPINKRHPEDKIARLENELFTMVNSTGVGPMGLGGKCTTLGVNVEYAHSHVASLPVGINFQCWANRKAGARIHKDGRVEYLW